MDIQKEIDSIVYDAQTKIADVAKRYVANSLVSSGPPAKVAPRAAKEPAEKAPVKKVEKAEKPAAKQTERKTGEKRDPAALAALQERLLAHITANPGQGVEQINKELGTKTPEISLPLKKLLADKAVKTVGEKRATKYFPR